MSDALARLEPRELWSHFSAIAGIPRPSKHEERIAAWVREVAARHEFEVRSDEVGNLVLSVPPTEGRSGGKPVILQGHLDMVCEKNADVTHDFHRDPIRPRIDGEWVHATGTTLGADNGIGVAAALAAATDPEVEHGPLELLFTLDEETGLTGAAGLDGSLLRGRTLLNLDSEEDGVLFVGCAGGADTHLFLDVEQVPGRPGRSGCRIGVRGLLGGHSGLNIHENRGNALKLLTRVLLAALESGIDLELCDVRGGSMHNAIPREAHALVRVDGEDVERLETLLARYTEGFRGQLRGIDEGLETALTREGDPGSVMTEVDRDRLLRLLMALPHGVLAMSPDIPGLVETSSNLAAIAPLDGRLRIVTSSRSSVAPAIDSVLAGIRSTGRLAGARVESHDGYPGWKPDMQSPLLAVVRSVYAQIWEREPEATAVHAGLECGLLGEKVPGLEMISFGPQIEGAHSPDERVHVASVGRFWRALLGVLDRLAPAV